MILLLSSHRISKLTKGEWKSVWCWVFLPNDNAACSAGSNILLSLRSVLTYCSNRLYTFHYMYSQIFHFVLCYYKKSFYLNLLKFNFVCVCLYAWILKSFIIAKIFGWSSLVSMVKIYVIRYSGYFASFTPYLYTFINFSKFFGGVL